MCKYIKFYEIMWVGKVPAVDCSFQKIASLCAKNSHNTLMHVFNLYAQAVTVTFEKEQFNS